MVYNEEESKKTMGSRKNEYKIMTYIYGSM